MNDLVIKSSTKGRVRLKSKLFTQDILASLKDEFSTASMESRVNEKCNSLIVLFDEKKVNLEKILKTVETKLLTCKTKVATQISHSQVACSVCTSCRRIEPQSWRKKLITFAGLSIYALVILVKEHLGLFASLAIPTPVTIGVALFAAIPLFKEAIEDIKQKRFTLQSFMSASLLGALFLGEVSAAFEVIYILRGGMLLEEWAAKRSKMQIHELLQSDIKKAFVLADGVEIETDLDEIRKGDIVVVRGGEKIPVDGIVVKGKAEISEALINGRSEPSFREEGDLVYANTLVEKGRVHVEVNAVGSETYLSRVIEQVEVALANRSQSEKAADILAAKLLRLGLFLTGFTLLATGSFTRAFSVMIVMSCPCATILAASTAVSAGIAKGAKSGVLIKGGEYLEKFSKCDVVCFDKTGTLTTGKPLVVEVIADDNTTKKELFECAAMAEYRNTHPIALSIVEHTKSLGISIDEQIDSEILPGLGAKAIKDDKIILVGNKALFAKNHISLEKYKKIQDDYSQEGKTVVYVSKAKKLLGCIVFEHEARRNSTLVVNRLKERGVKKVYLLTGDDEKVAHSFAKKYGFDGVYANILPEEKANIIKELKKEHEVVVMIGDGINDTIAMSKADIGISFASGGSEAAVEVSDIAITNSNVDDIVFLHDLSKKTLNVVEQNYWIGTGTNLAGVFFAALGGLSPVAAGALHVVHTIGIMANASRLTLESDNDSKGTLSFIKES